ncbi:thermonuclease family protein [Pseudomonas sp. EMN2]|uniref:thermonuclease family protein n=1 Tax=Pseudomonas sp. EMN2 TaxID=2615212 RepID=UPI00129A622F|nr:thermonuclease family protein [Pseudomonas sp. EMN2]
MKRSVLVLALSLCFSSAFAAGDFHGKAVRVLDGDTVDVLTAQNQTVRVRLANIDAPEKSQAFGQRSRQNLTSLIAGRMVDVHVQNQDQYGRKVGRVVADGVEANTEQVRAGLAWVYTRYNQDRRLPAIEAQAKREQLGLWSDPQPLEPWMYRRQNK